MGGAGLKDGAGGRGQRPAGLAADTQFVKSPLFVESGESLTGGLVAHAHELEGVHDALGPRWSIVAEEVLPEHRHEQTPARVDALDAVAAGAERPRQRGSISKFDVWLGVRYAVTVHRRALGYIDIDILQSLDV